MTRSLLLFALAGSLTLGACGKVGALEQPAPLYGAKAKADYEARKQAAAEAAAARKADDQIETLPDEKRYDPNADPTSSRTLPIPGAHTPPNGPPQPGVLPDPYNDPK
jgi:hypothetical protein